MTIFSAARTVTVYVSTASEAGETIRVAFRQPVNAEIAQGIDMGTIVDRQRRGITFCVGDVVVSEIDAIFVARLSVPSAQVVTTIHQIVNGVAEVGADYVAAAGTLEFASGEKEIRAKLLRSARD